MSRKPSPRWRFRRLSLQVLDDRRVLAAVTGAVFADLDESSTRQVDESGLAGRLVYVDQNENASLDEGEPFALTDQAGEFSLQDLTAGTHFVRLFNGTPSQVQTSPLSVGWNQSVQEIAGIGAATPAFSSPVDGDISPAVFVNGTLLQSLSQADGQPESSIDLGHAVTAVGRLEDSRVWAIGGEVGDPRGWIIDSDLSVATPLDFTGFGTVPSDFEIKTVALDDRGRGVLMTQAGDSGEDATLWKIDVTAASPVSPTTVQLPSDSVLSGDPTPRPSGGPTRVIVAVPQSLGGQPSEPTDSLAVHLWNHDDSGPLSQPIVIQGATEVVAFSDTAGLLVLRHEDHLTVHDVDNSLATLYQLPDTASPLAIDADRGWLVQSSADQSSLRWFDAETGAGLAETAIDLATLGQDVRLRPDAALQAVLAVGSTGIAEISLRRAGARRVELSEGETSSPVLFGLKVSGENAAPQWSGSTVWDAIEDTTLDISAAQWAQRISDSDEPERADSFVSLLTSPPSLGTVSLDPSGAVSYAPSADAFGTDSVNVLLHDGRDFTEVTLTIEIAPLADPATGLESLVDPFPEDILPGQALGPIYIRDVDYPDGLVAAGVDHEVQLLDPRFEVQGGQLVYVGGTLDYESEPELYLTASVQSNDGLGGSLPTHIYLQVTDADDPTEAILPEQASVRENEEAAVVGWLTVIDEDTNQVHTLEVDDPRFEINQGVLQLVAGASLDREAEPTVTVNVTANADTEGELTRAITIHVLDVPESPQQMTLEGDTVRELEVGAVVGTVLVDGNPASNGHTVTVDNADFVVEDSVLKLVDGSWVTQQEQSFIVLNITAGIESDAVSPRSLTQEYTIEVLANPTPYHNDELPYDVSGDGEVSAVDALIVINHLNEHGPGPVGAGDPVYGVDVNGDGMITALDALLIINEINRLEAAVGAVKGEGESEPPQPGQLAEQTEPLSPPSQQHFAASPPKTDVPAPALPAPENSAPEESTPAVDLQAQDLAITVRSDWLDESPETPVDSAAQPQDLAGTGSISSGQESSPSRMWANSDDVQPQRPVDDDVVDAVWKDDGIELLGDV